ncbi:MAG: hypothetical protein DWG76_03695 [Chloroflexi bacterium]|nr:hypothetical protein [Chloroflexota bacterium]
MKIIDNEALYRRNSRLALVANLGGMLMLVAAVFVLFNTDGQLGRYFLFLLGGILLVQLGLYFGRWSKRPDLAINSALKSLDDSYTIYHQRSPAQHLLIGPAGLWLLLPKFTSGEIFFNKEKQRWDLRGGNIFKRFWQRFTQERLGRPHFEAMIEAGLLDRLLEKHWDAKDPLHVQAAVVFLSDQANVQTGDAPFPAVLAKKLKGVVTKSESDNGLNKAQLKRLNMILNPPK